ncbi:transmembrane reductase CYB561D2-like [Culex pipiens pallens]|nr:transmembrane reductase CYB561D2-like [Culex pipiens pallens]
MTAEASLKTGEPLVNCLAVAFNTINHVLIGYVTIYLSYVSYMNGFGKLFTWHMFLCTIGYQFFMAESFLTLYSANSWTVLYGNEVKRRWHWVLQAVGFVAIFVGVGLEIYIKEDNGRAHFKSDHAITGLVSMVFLVLSMMNGLAALYAMKIKHLIKPIYIKLCHYLTGIVAFVIGMVSLMLEYSPRRMQSKENVNMLISFSSITIILTLIGVSKTMLNQFKGMMS